MFPISLLFAGISILSCKNDTEITNAIKANQAPPAPVKLTAQATSASTITLGWKAGGDQTSSYQLQRCPGDGCEGFAALATTDRGQSTYQDSGLTAATSYRYRLRAVNAAGAASSYSPVTEATTLTEKQEKPGTEEPEGLLFEDDFSAGNLSKHNDWFRWGRTGNIISATDQTSYVTTATGPDGRTSQMMIFDYKPGDRWDEMRFHLTESVDEKRTEIGLSDVAYPELWVRFWMRIPYNYYHGLKDGTASGSNSKGWIYLWNGPYELDGPKPPSVSNKFAWWPVTGPEEALGNSVVAVEKGFTTGHDRTPDYVRRTEKVPDGSGKAWAITKAERGQWIDYTLHFKLASGPGRDDGVAEICKNGELAMSWSTNSWPRDGNADRAGFDRGYLMGYHNVDVKERQEYYLDDFRIGTTAESVGLSR